MTSRPATVTVPLSGSIMRLMMRIVVVLPQPDGPISTHTSPSGTVSVRWSTAGRGAPGNCLVSAQSISIMRRAHPARRQATSAGAAEQLIGADRQQRRRNRADQQLRQRHHRDARGDEIAQAAAADVRREHGAGDDLHGGGANAGEDRPAVAIGSSTPRTISRARHAHAARGVDDVGIDLAHRGVGVDQDRRQREQRQREQRWREAGAEDRHDQREHRERRQRAADVGER